VSWRSESNDGLSFVGSPITLYRTTSALHADQARNNWDAYVCATLAGSQGEGGRFNPKGEFGALYTADDDTTVWHEVAARYKRDGVPGLPATMHLLHIVVAAGRYADLRESEVRDDFRATLEVLKDEDPTEEQKEICWGVARVVRAVADFLISPSARAAGNNVPLYPDRTDSELHCTFAAALGGQVPAHLAQSATESW
jgi:RES domain-containing protein